MNLLLSIVDDYLVVYTLETIIDQNAHMVSERMNVTFGAQLGGGRLQYCTSHRCRDHGRRNLFETNLGNN
jgi:hypothetical protein